MESKTKNLSLDVKTCSYIDRQSENKDSYKMVTGNLSHIDESSYEWEGEKQSVLTFTIAGAEGNLYMLKAGKYSKVALDYLNRLAGIDDLMQIISFIPYKRKGINGWDEVRGGMRYGIDNLVAEFKYPDMDKTRPTENKVKMLLSELQKKLAKLRESITYEGDQI